MKLYEVLLITRNNDANFVKVPGILFMGKQPDLILRGWAPRSRCVKELWRDRRESVEAPTDTHAINFMGLCF
ncbi:MAG: hypothetical protein IGR92_11105 [Leptolyngbyaceae cyanobacterium T60_A2020_046]|nr:hypothetical protein [Leptolyngbyaceae cyanobacterium T60_A2020_046]